MAIQNAAFPVKPKGKFGLGGITPRGGNNGPNARQYFPDSEQAPRMQTADMQQYTNPFTGEQQTGHHSTHNHDRQPRLGSLPCQQEQSRRHEEQERRRKGDHRREHCGKPSTSSINSDVIR